jgi:diacylglycerol kinase (ATP)
VTSPFGPLRLIANPAAGRGRDPVLPRLRAALDERDLEHDVAHTEGPEHASQLARQAIEDGCRYVVAVGGDGTVLEVVNGLVDAEDGPRADDLVLGVVPAGSGSDFVRTFGLNLAPERMARHLDGEDVMPIDLGRIRLRTREGDERTVLFANIAEAGYGAVVVDRASRYPRFFGQVRYLVAAIASVRAFQLTEAEITLDHTTVEGRISNLVVANGQFFGGAMKVAPRALPDDGRYNVQIWRGSTKDVFVMTPKVRRGDHTSSAEVAEYQSSRVEIRTERPVLIEADGEVLGTTDAVFDLLPKAIALKI